MLDGNERLARARHQPIERGKVRLAANDWQYIRIGRGAQYRVVLDRAGHPAIRFRPA